MAIPEMEHQRRAGKDFMLILAFAFAALAFHLLVNAFGGYGIFRDEYYYPDLFINSQKTQD